MSTTVGTNIPTTRLLYVIDSPFFDALRCTVATQEQWQALWSAYGNPEQAPKVDFATHAVLFAAMGEQPSVDHYIHIHRIYRVGDTTYAQVRLLYPQGDEVGAAMTQPATAVLVPRGLGRAVFVE